MTSKRKRKLRIAAQSDGGFQLPKGVKQVVIRNRSSTALEYGIEDGVFVIRTASAETLAAMKEREPAP
jgi:hypothetical protein